MWLPYPIDYGYADQPLHAGVCVDILRGNLRHVAEANGADVVIGPTVDHDGETHWKYTLTAPDTWYLFHPRWPPVMLRPREGSLEARQVEVTIRAWLSAPATVTVRAYLRGSRDLSAYSVPFPGEDAYAAMTVTQTAKTVKTGTVSYPEPGPALPPMVHPDDELGGTPPPQSRAELVLVASSDTALIQLSVESIRLEEVYS